MRIISGKYKNRKIEFRNLKARPTTDFAKESLFNLLQNNYDLSEVIALDLFAGCGNISYEFISRGSIKTIAIDSNLPCVNFIKKMKKKLEMDNLEIYYSTAIKHIYQTKCKFDVIFIDPPYSFDQKKYNEILDTIYKKNILKKEGAIVVEHSKLINFNTYTQFSEQRKYGKVHFSFLTQ